jgi:hypothetical protein
MSFLTQDLDVDQGQQRYDKHGCTDGQRDDIPKMEFVEFTETFTLRTMGLSR